MLIFIAQENHLMELYDSILKIIDHNIIYCLIPIILTLLLVKYGFKERFQTAKAVNIIRWFIIGYTAVTLVHFVLLTIFYPTEFTFTARAFGPYKIIYWFMLVCAIFLPFTLLIKKLGMKFWYILLIAFLMKIGFYFERFVLLTTNLNSDYESATTNADFMNSPIAEFLVIVVQGIILAVLVLFIIQTLEDKKNFKNKDSGFRQI